jgi:hypothetical protein|tara:strand:+ start:134 stop:529 length:396 start_codon:yes stop_codon:yes gene_type:complete
MKKSKSKTKQKLFSAGSELRKGYTMPTLKKIKTVLRSRSKTFLVNLVMSMFSTMTKSAKIKVLVKIEKGTIARKTKRKSKGVKRKSATKRNGSTFKKSKTNTKGLKSYRSPAQKRNDKRLGKMAKARARKR